MKKKIKRITHEPIWIIKQPNANLIDGKSPKKKNKKHHSKKKAKKLRKTYANLLNLI